MLLLLLRRRHCSSYHQLIRNMSSTHPQVQIPSTAWSSAVTDYGRSGAQELLSSPGSSGSGWILSPQTTKDGLEREYKFTGFAKAMKFMNVVAEECKRRKHHPEWANVYNVVRVRWTTHRPRGISDLDVAMALFCDRAAAEIGFPTPAPAAAAQGRQEGQQSKDGEESKEEEEGSVLDRMVAGPNACGACAGGKQG